MKILIADDSAFMRTILKNIIAKSKWADAEIVEAVDGADAIAKYKAEQPDLVLLDIIMPVQDGIGVLKEIGQSAPAVVIVSSVDQTEIIDEAKTLGAKDYITKPYDAKQVITLLDEMLSQKES
jgi:two-component system chemotaxis response regulator CheY